MWKFTIACILTLKKMKNLFVSFILILSAITLFGQNEKQIESRITEVTVFLNKAQVNREAKSRLESGKTNLVLSGLTSQLDPQSIQISGKGNFVILGINHRQNYLSEVNMPKSLKVLKDSIELLQKEVVLSQSQKEILSKEEQMLLSNQKIGGSNQNLTVGELKAMADFYRGRLTDIVSSRMKLDEKIRKMNERITKLNFQFNEQNGLLSRNTSEIVISVSAEAPLQADLKVSYVVANAGWNAVYDVRAINTKSPLQLNYKANVFQNTGEEWKNVKLKLSTANPNQSGLKPELHSWYLDFYNPIVYQMDKREKLRTYKSAPVQAEAARMEISEEEHLVNAQSVSDYVTNVQTSLNTEFEISLPYSVPSSAKATVVDIRNYEMIAEYSYSVAPKLDADAFLMAKATGWEEFRLLPGEANIFFEGTFVGNSYIDPNNINDTLSVSLGRDKRIIVKREKLKDLTSRSVMGNLKKENYTWEISVRNSKAEPIKITIEDQVPVSQNTQIEITVADTGGAIYNKQSGKLTWQIEVKPGETRKMTLKYEVKYPKDKQIIGLN
jgi:uncharacterized protein (TIGR02231 family)